MFQPATLTTVTLLYRSFSVFLNCINDTKSRKASHMKYYEFFGRANTSVACLLCQVVARKYYHQKWQNILLTTRLTKILKKIPPISNIGQSILKSFVDFDTTWFCEFVLYPLALFHFFMLQFSNYIQYYVYIHRILNQDGCCSMCFISRSFYCYSLLNFALRRLGSQIFLVPTKYSLN